MKKYFVSLAVGLCVFSFLISAGARTGLAQADSGGVDISIDLRPFDFTDKYYESNGLLAERLTDRRNGADGQSVFDIASEPIHSNIRIIATRAAYGPDGSTLFWNYYAAAALKTFTENAAGQNALAVAYAYPIYVFPAVTVKNSDRQAALIRINDNYFDKNPLGLGAVMLVEYTDHIFTRRGRIVLEELANRNGLSLDGTPIIRTASDIDTLLDAKLITVSQADPVNGRPAFVVGRVIRNPQSGAIAPDAFLDFVKTSGGKPLVSEEHFVSQFECLQSGMSDCL